MDIRLVIIIDKFCGISYNEIMIDLINNRTSATNSISISINKAMTMSSGVHIFPNTFYAVLRLSLVL